MIYVLAQLALPGQDDNPWIWLCGMLGAALVYMFKVYNDNRSAEYQQRIAELDRERTRNDTLVASLPEIVTIMRELKDAQANQPRP